MEAPTSHIAFVADDSANELTKFIYNLKKQ